MPTKKSCREAKVMYSYINKKLHNGCHHGNRNEFPSLVSQSLECRKKTTGHVKVRVLKMSYLIGTGRGDLGLGSGSRPLQCVTVSGVDAHGSLFFRCFTISMYLPDDRLKSYIRSSAQQHCMYTPTGTTCAKYGMPAEPNSLSRPADRSIHPNPYNLTIIATRMAHPSFQSPILAPSSPSLLLLGRNLSLHLPSRFENHLVSPSLQQALPLLLARTPALGCFSAFGLLSLGR